MIDLLLSPQGIVALVAVIAVIGFACQHAMLRWMLLGAAMFAASLQKYVYVDPVVTLEGPPHIGVVETLVQNGRPVTVAALVIFLAVSLFSGTRRPASLNPSRIMWPVYSIQALLLVKMLLGEASTTFVVQAAVIYLLLALTAIYAIRPLLAISQDFTGPAVALATALLLFCGITEYEIIVNRQAVVLGNGRLIGTCGNPNHAAALLVICLPGALYLLLKKGSLLWVRGIGAGLTVSATHLLILTGSRTGALMALIALCIFLRRKLLMTTVAAAIIFAVYLAIAPPDTPEARQFDTGLDAPRITSLHDSRSHVWAAQWRIFLKHPAFGQPVTGDRLGFGENSWLAVLAATGIPGGLLLLWLLIALVQSLTRVLMLRTSRLDWVVAGSLCMAGLAAFFVGTFFEAYLLGIITLPIIALAVYSETTMSLLVRSRTGLVTPCQTLHPLRATTR